MTRCSFVCLGWLIITATTAAREPIFATEAKLKVEAEDGVGADQALFEFSEAKDWAAFKLPQVEKDQPAPLVDLAAKAKSLKLSFAGGDWPCVSTTKIPIEGDWKSFQTLKADLTVERSAVVYFGICQEKADKPTQPVWERTLLLQPGRNEVVLTIRQGIARTVINPANGKVTRFVIGMHRPAKGQTLLVSNVRLSTEWPPPKVTGWYSPYNHDGYSSAAARDYARSGKLPRFKVLGTDQEVADLPELAKKLQDSWKKPEAKTIEQVEAEFQADFEKLKQKHAKAAMAILREGEKGWDPAQPDKAYQGWKYVYLNCHGPDGPNPGRERTVAPAETVEVFMRHRSVIMRVDLSSLPKGARILAARLVVTRSAAADLKVPEKPNLWVAEPCNREWDETAANCYYYAADKHWKGVSGLYYGDDPDFWPVFLTHGPAGGGAVSDWDFREALKFWLDGQHANHGFFLHGDAKDYMRMYTPRAANLKQRPAVMVIYEPGS